MVIRWQPPFRHGEGCVPALSHLSGFSLIKALFWNEVAHLFVCMCGQRSQGGFHMLHMSLQRDQLMSAHLCVCVCIYVSAFERVSCNSRLWIKRPVCVSVCVVSNLSLSDRILLALLPAHLVKYTFPYFFPPSRCKHNSNVFSPSCVCMCHLHARLTGCSEIIKKLTNAPSDFLSTPHPVMLLSFPVGSHTLQHPSLLSIPPEVYTIAIIWSFRFPLTMTVDLTDNV